MGLSLPKISNREGELFGNLHHYLYLLLHLCLFLSTEIQFRSLSKQSNTLAAMAAWSWSLARRKEEIYVQAPGVTVLFPAQQAGCSPVN